MRRGNRTGDDPVDVQVGSEVPIGLLEQGEREVELGRGDALPKVEVHPVRHGLVSGRSERPLEAKPVEAVVGDRGQRYAG